MKMKIIALYKRKFLNTLYLNLVLSLAACTNDFLPELSIDTVSVYTDIDANQNSATSVDLVIVYDQELEKTLGQMSAAKYFSSSKQLLLDNPTLLDIWHWELVPGQIVQDFTPPQEQGDAFAAYVFANYLTPGDHRLKVAPTGIVKILLQKNDLKNLAIYDVHDVRVGTTMTSVTTQRGSDEDEDEEPPQIKLGPTKEVPTLSKKGDPKTTQTSAREKCMPSALYNPAPLKKPVPIVTRPLCPPAAVRKPCRK